MIISEDLQGVLHTNRVIVDGYLSDPVFLKLDLLIRSVLPTVNHDAELEISMMPYVQQEEQRIDENLRAVAFDIDDQNTLSLITGPGRIERVRCKYITDIQAHDIVSVYISTHISPSAESFSDYQSRAHRGFTQERIQ